MLPSPVVPTPPVAAASTRAMARFQAQAYCGPAHGQRWTVDTVDPHAAVDLSTATGAAVCYRLVRHPRTLRPARDRHGRYVYMPLRYLPPAPAAGRGRSRP